jgi:Icc-related predicted phosphoesterase
MKVIYTSDIHANDHHLFALTSKAAHKAVDAVIVGGDIVPHYLPEAKRFGIVDAQAIYLREVFVPAIQDFQKHHDISIYLDLANDDFICNRKILEDSQNDKFKLIHMQKHGLTENVDIIGYMNVPPTPFQRKDWEKPDSRQWPYAKGKNVALKGYSTVNGNVKEVVIDLMSADNIESDLERLSKQIEKPFIFASHSPPYDTPLDILYNGFHAGSLSIRKFIEKWSEKGLLIASLHGHIHESPERSGSIYTQIGKSLCINPGQNAGEHMPLRYVIFDILEEKTMPFIRITELPRT